MTKVFIDGHPTTLKLYAGVMTTTASALIAMEYPRYELQALTCIGDMVWFNRLFLDSTHLTVQLLKSFVIHNVEEVLDSLGGTP